MTVIAMFIGYLGRKVVPRRGLEPPRPYRHQHLKLARLPFRHLGTDGSAELRIGAWAVNAILGVLWFQLVQVRTER
jgi:hypothetical protein